MQVGIHIFYFLVKELSLMYGPTKIKKLQKQNDYIIRYENPVKTD